MEPDQTVTNHQHTAIFFEYQLPCATTNWPHIMLGFNCEGRLLLGRGIATARGIGAVMLGLGVRGDRGTSKLWIMIREREREREWDWRHRFAVGTRVEERGF